MVVGILASLGVESLVVSAEDIRQFVVENLMLGNQRPIADTDSFLECGIIDSTSVLELIEYLEERCGFKIQDQEVVPENLDSIQNIVLFLARKAGNMTAAA